MGAKTRVFVCEFCGETRTRRQALLDHKDAEHPVLPFDEKPEGEPEPGSTKAESLSIYKDVEEVKMPKMPQSDISTVIIEQVGGVVEITTRVLSNQD